MGSLSVDRPPRPVQTTNPTGNDCKAHCWRDFEDQPPLHRMPDGSRITLTYNADLRRVQKDS